MSDYFFWMHEKALKQTTKENQPIFIWDESYFKNRGYSLKRLVFIYETLCEMDAEIIKAPLFEAIKFFKPKKIKTIFTTDTVIRGITEKLSLEYEVEVIEPKPFIKIEDKEEFNRFFKYWNEAKKSAFLINGEDET
jgi:hypothetical protein